jgi:hypothetical protein
MKVAFMPDDRKHVSNILAEVFKRSGMKRAVRRAEAVLLWQQVAGPEVSRFTEAKSLKDGVLWVEVPDSETGMHLMLQRQRFLDVYRGKFGVRDVQEIRFRVGRPSVQVPRAATAQKTPQVDPLALAKFARTLSSLPEPLVEPAMQAAKSLLLYRESKLAEGWQTCPLCEALTPEAGLCHTCQRYATDPKVARASQALAVNPQAPTPLLSDEERQVASHLAQDYLLKTLNTLLPHVLADPTYRLEFETVARCYVAHKLNKSLSAVEDADFDMLDSRVARALGRWH